MILSNMSIHQSTIDINKYNIFIYNNFQEIINT